MDDDKLRDHLKDELIRRKKFLRNYALVIVIVTLAIVLFALWQGSPWWVALCVVLSVLLSVILAVVFNKFLKKMDK